MQFVNLPRILNSCWKVAWPECVRDKHSTNQVSDIITSICHLSHKIGGEGFDNLKEIDIKEMFEDDSLEEDDIIFCANMSGTYLPHKNRIACIWN